MKKIALYAGTAFVAGIVLLVLGYVLYMSLFTFCEGFALYFSQFFEQETSSELKLSFTDAINANTEILQDCTVASYTQAPDSELHERLRKYEIKKYSVKYKCDILNFSLDVYTMDDKFYTLSYRSGPCSTENVYFDIMPKNSVETWYSTEYLLEYMIISDHLDNHTFCTALEKKIYGSDDKYCK